ncbi:MAG: 7-carboxy-7-deazaguanine synthase QueE [Alphaproteobacteria bacterium]|nr:7-carboxy-7-deazaguanine synthase QueE [Alphaproteobacteria bacterium]
MPRDSIKVSEIFGPTIQGEGALIGQPTVFVRTGGCDYRCAWCDTLHAVESEYRDQWLPMSSTEIFARIEELSGDTPLLVTLSGGNPAIHPLEPLIDLGHEKNYSFALETQGSMPRPWFSKLDVLTLSPKPPSSEIETDWLKLDSCVENGMKGKQKTHIVLKIIVRDKKDYAYARATSDRYPDLPVYLQPLNEQPDNERGKTQDGNNILRERDTVLDRTRWLAEFVIHDRWYKATVLPQLHVLLWGDKKGV